MFSIKNRYLELPLCLCADPIQSLLRKASPSVLRSLLNKLIYFAYNIPEKKERSVSLAELIHPSIFICFRAELAADSHRRGYWQLNQF